MKHLISLMLLSSSFTYGIDGPTAPPPPEQPKGMNGPLEPMKRNDSISQLKHYEREI